MDLAKPSSLFKNPNAFKAWEFLKYCLGDAKFQVEVCPRLPIEEAFLDIYDVNGGHEIEPVAEAMAKVWGLLPPEIRRKFIKTHGTHIQRVLRAYLEDPIVIGEALMAIPASQD